MNGTMKAWYAGINIVPVPFPFKSLGGNLLGNNKKRFKTHFRASFFCRNRHVLAKII